MLVIGLTGGIASGKSTVAALFAEKGIDVIDTDVIAKTLTMPGQPAYETMVRHFGENILCEDKTLNRRKLREIIFNDQTEKKWLEDLLHPLIHTDMLEQIQHSHTPYTVAVIPLLVETYPYPYIHRILVIDIDEDVQIARAIKRDNMSEKLTKEIIAQQASKLQRDKFADDIIYNNDSIAALKEQVDLLHQKYLALTHL